MVKSWMRETVGICPAT